MNANARALTSCPGLYAGLSLSVTNVIVSTFAPTVIIDDTLSSGLANTFTSCSAMGADVVDGAAEEANSRNLYLALVTSADAGTVNNTVCASPFAATAVAEATVDGVSRVVTSASTTVNPFAPTVPCTRTETELPAVNSAGAKTRGVEAAETTLRQLASTASATGRSRRDTLWRTPDDSTMVSFGGTHGRVARQEVPTKKAEGALELRPRHSPRA